MWKNRKEESTERTSYKFKWNFFIKIYFIRLIWKIIFRAHTPLSDISLSLKSENIAIAFSFCGRDAVARNRVWKTHTRRNHDDDNYTAGMVRCKSSHPRSRLFRNRWCFASMRACGIVIAHYAQDHEQFSIVPFFFVPPKPDSFTRCLREGAYAGSHTNSHARCAAPCFYISASHLPARTTLVPLS